VAASRLLGALGHVLRSDRLGGLGPQLRGLLQQARRLLLGVGALATTALLVGLALNQVLLPVEVVLVHLGAIGVQVVDLRDHGVQQAGVVADHQDAARVGGQEAAQPRDRVGVQVVGGLVEQQGVGPREQDARQFDPAALTTRQGPIGLGQHPVGQAEVRRDPGRLRLGRVAARRGQLGLGAA
jgi:hypothetical protein